MGKKAKGSRKGKKAWRANISTQDIEDYFHISNKEALSGGPLADLPSNSLFFEDKSTDLSVKRRIEKQREKILHCESMLQRNPFVQPVPSSKCKSQQKQKELPVAVKTALNSQKDDVAIDSGMVDIWDDKGEPAIKARKKFKPSSIPAVEVEPLGCSFNPPFESHQDSLACAVADEMQKIYQDELGPEPIPLVVPGEVISEEDKYFLEADNGSDDEDLNEIDEENEDTNPEHRPPKTKRVTRVEQNRRARRQEQLKAEADVKKVEELSKEIDSLPDIIREIAKEDEEKHKRHIRRVVAREERQKSRPPRLGKHKFKPAPMQVLLSEDITGSLRQLKGCCTLVRDRFKSLEKRGLVVPTAKSSRK